MSSVRPLFFALFAATLAVATSCAAPIESSAPDAATSEPDAARPPRTDSETLTPFDRTRISSISTDKNFQKAEAELDWGDDPKTSVTLVVDLASTCFPFSNWNTNLPPPRQNWPADCDAFDRNFDFSLTPGDAAAGAPGFDLVRAITPFGGPLHFEVDLTDLANALPGKNRLRTSIATWSDANGQVSGSHGGWNVTAKLAIHYGPAPRRVLAARAIFDGSQTTTGDSEAFHVAIPDGVTSTRLEYRATGHGGGDMDPDCIGPADEFCKRILTLSVDGKALAPFQPWREDCQDLCTLKTQTWPGGGTQQYCAENPCGSIQSVKAPRANWCPGSITPPKLYNVPALRAAGEHTVSWNVSKVGTNGGTWRISAWLVAYGD